jgi:hypothetical protein
LASCISQTLSTSYGEDVKKVIFFQLKAETLLDSEGIAKRPEIFSSYLDRFFGQTASNLIKQKLISELRNEFSVSEDYCSSFEGIIRAIISK